MGSCVSKTKAARARQGKVAAPLPPVVEKEGAQSGALPPVVEEEEVKEVVLSETPVPRPPSKPEPEPEPVKRRQDQHHPGPGQDAGDEAASETCSASSAAKETAKLVQKARGAEREVVEKRAVVDAPEKGRAAAAREDRDRDRERERESKAKAAKGGTGAGRALSRSPSHRRQGQPHPPAQWREHHPPVVSGIGCRSGRFSASAARRAAESAAVRRTHSAREADMALPSSKRSLAAGATRRERERDPGERSWRRSDSPTGRRAAPASPISAAIHRPASGTTSPMRKAAHGTPERGSSRPPRGRDGGGDEQPGPWAGGDEQKRRLQAEEGALGQNNPSVAMECFIFL